ncbi:DUF2218 domain-containing protein [Bailinhaonella thermotolerans]|uniref:DUF2218 domain-containing protein n=1 Tax=Bailinhaonella thermotolerans TaxID=1070861 RepID=A0A3A4A6C3_9ACTN|nr:DUF2218 domain-containing protein [Bailinhaonella thermotolerans]RJL24456.1 DUF2218 domain-containing protein [Bailinhaonella thermotolerans]
MLTSEARVPTPSGARYAKQLCGHMGHRVRTEWTPPDGVIEFPDGGSCHLTATQDALLLTLRADQPGTLDRMRTLVAVHLERFGRRDGLTVDWSEARVTGPPVA